MENKLFHFSIQLFVRVREEGKRDPGPGCILCAREHILYIPESNRMCNDRCFALCSGSWGLWFSFLFDDGPQDSPYQRRLLQSFISAYLQLWPWYLWFWRKQLDPDQGRLWVLYILSNMEFITDMKTGAVLWAWQRCSFLGRCTTVLASEDALGGVLFDSRLQCFSVSKLKGHEHFTFGSRSVPEEVKHCLMAGFKQEKLFYADRANWGVNHAETSEARRLSRQFPRTREKIASVGTNTKTKKWGQSLIINLCIALSAMPEGVLNPHCSSWSSLLGLTPIKKYCFYHYSVLAQFWIIRFSPLQAMY